MGCRKQRTRDQDAGPAEQRWFSTRTTTFGALLGTQKLEHKHATFQFSLEAT